MSKTLVTFLVVVGISMILYSEYKYKKSKNSFQNIKIR
jgi:hypothetical protein